MNAVNVESVLNKGRFVNVLKWMAVSATVVGGSVFSQGVLAACTFNGLSGLFLPSQSTIEIDPSLSNSDTLATITMTATGSGSTSTCTPGSTLKYQSNGLELAFGNIYKTGISGVGMKVEVLIPEVADPYILLPESVYSFGFNRIVVTSADIRLTLIKTGEIVSGGDVPLELLATIYSPGDLGVLASIDSAGGLPVKLMKPTCSAASTNPNVSLDSVSTADFEPSGRAKSTGFNIDLRCTGAGTTDISVTLTDANRAGNTGATLTAAAGSDAEGIALEVHKGSGSSSPVQFGSKWLAIPGAGVGSGSIPLSVNYLKTGPLKSGEVKAGMTYTLDYE